MLLVSKQASSRCSWSPGKLTKRNPLGDIPWRSPIHALDAKTTTCACFAAEDPQERACAHGDCGSTVDFSFATPYAFVVCFYPTSRRLYPVVQVHVVKLAASHLPGAPKTRRLDRRAHVPRAAPAFEAREPANGPLSSPEDHQGSARRTKHLSGNLSRPPAS
ncbi:uncharacterized protein LOC142557006 isoform X10 [Dermacentor variabilis]|uniref:uncharacterized protein LOC142557006 isoform X10 n=1 Tax=Dermacentor variabilis TaxID=34621 RepID=UPI003F5C04FD